MTEIGSSQERNQYKDKENYQENFDSEKNSNFINNSNNVTEKNEKAEKKEFDFQEGKISSINLNNLNENDDLYLMILHRSLYILKKKFDLNQTGIKKIYEKFSEKNKYNKLLDSEKFVEVLHQIFKLCKVNFLDIKYPSDLFKAEIVEEYSEEKLNMVERQIKNFMIKSRKNFNDKFKYKKIEEFYEKFKQEKSESNRKNNFNNNNNNTNNNNNNNNNFFNNKNSINSGSNENIAIVKENNNTETNTENNNVNNSKILTEKSPKGNKLNESNANLNESKISNAKFDETKNSKASKKPDNKKLSAPKKNSIVKGKESSSKTLVSSSNDNNNNDESKITKIEELNAKIPKFEEKNTPNNNNNFNSFNKENLNTGNKNNSNEMEANNLVNTLQENSNIIDNSNFEGIESIQDFQTKKIDEELLSVVNDDNNDNKIRKKLIISDAIPLIIAEFIHENINIAILDMSDELKSDIRILFDKDIIKKIEEYSNYDLDSENALKMKEYLFERLNTEKNIKTYEDLLMTKKTQGENTNHIIHILDKLRHHLAILERKIRDLQIENDYNSNRNSGGNNNNGNRSTFIGGVLDENFILDKTNLNNVNISRAYKTKIPQKKSKKNKFKIKNYNIYRIKRRIKRRKSFANF